ncbi:galactose-binding domain-like protein [Crucibulum laeve]|uniref:Galactose-binding domain-like protein n=1 Tax=Crucibulum laeve TaxID=68775 RepID=A0A5C3MDM4_9AGAR|nr:galactose-binding domain-like protein [Crucibulum laeve]
MTSADDLIPLLSADTSVKVSSTLDKSVGKKYLIDGNPETCWTSQQGLPQFIQLGFPKPVIPRRISIIFQGGFVGTRCSVQVPVLNEDGTPTKDWKVFTSIYPEDVNRKQTFALKPLEPELVNAKTSALKLVFEESSDFFGRITVYDLALDGSLA